MLNNISFYLLIFIFISCGSNDHNIVPNNDFSSDSKHLNITEMTELLCQCLEPLVKINTEMEKLQLAGDTQALKKAFYKLIKIGEKTSNCYNRINNKYSKEIKSMEFKAVLKKTCPFVENRYEDIKDALDIQSGSYKE